MRRRRFVVGLGMAGASALFFGRTARAFAPPVRPIRVRLFSGYELRGAVIGGVRVDASSAPTVVSAHGSPVDLSVTTSDGSVIGRHYEGTILSAPVEGALAIYNDVDVESYVASVMASEISPSWQPEALQAQAIAIRTYGMRRMHHAKTALYDVTDDTTNQVYHGVDSIVSSLSAATSATAGKIVTSGGEPADVWYHSACGGHTASSAEINGVSAPPYLQGSPDVDAAGRAYCAASPYYTWRNSLSAASLASVADVAALASIAISQRWPDGRVKTVHVQGTDGTAHDIDGHHFYSRATDVLGYKVVPSSLFDIAAAGLGYEITGHGVGHGVGMCQWGAQGRAKAGQDAATILGAYFPGTTIA
jgi:stage II sporulation protein D (peptidoglycan lytic transglycosylase)